MPVEATLSDMAKKKSDGRAVFRIEITPQAVAVLGEIKSRVGMTEIAISSKLIEWMAEQPDEIKLGILGVFPDLVKEDPVTLYLKRLAR